MGGADWMVLPVKPMSRAAGWRGCRPRPGRCPPPAGGADQVVVDDAEAVEHVGRRANGSILVVSGDAVEVAREAVAVDLDARAGGDRDGAVAYQPAPWRPLPWTSSLRITTCRLILDEDPLGEIVSTDLVSRTRVVDASRRPTTPAVVVVDVGAAAWWPAPHPTPRRRPRTHRTRVQGVVAGQLGTVKGRGVTVEPVQEGIAVAALPPIPSPGRCRCSGRRGPACRRPLQKAGPAVVQGRNVPDAPSDGVRLRLDGRPLPVAGVVQDGRLSRRSLRWPRPENATSGLRPPSSTAPGFPQKVSPDFGWTLKLRKWVPASTR